MEESDINITKWVDAAIQDPAQYDMQMARIGTQLSQDMENEAQIKMAYKDMFGVQEGQTLKQVRMNVYQDFKNSGFVNKFTARTDGVSKQIHLQELSDGFNYQRPLEK